MHREPSHASRDAKYVRKRLTSFGAKFWTSDALLSVVAAAALVLTVGSWWAQKVARDERSASVAVAERRMADSRVDVVRVVDSVGLSHELIVADGLPKVLVLLSTTCEACKRSIAEWQQLARELPIGFGVLAVGTESTDRITRFVDAPGIRPIRMAGDEMGRSFPSGYLPTTMIIGGDGRIAQVRIGTFEARHRRSAREVVDSLKSLVVIP